MSQFKFKILDYHTKAILDENSDIMFVPIIEHGLKSFHLTIDINDIRILGYRSDAIIDNDGDATEVVKVFLSDGSIVFAANKLDTFEKNYRDEYLTLFKS